MNKINWKLAPEGAIGVAQRGQQLAFVDNDRNIFLDGHWGISMGWDLVAKRPTFAESITKTPQLEQTKTAEGDFVEVNEQESEPEWTHIDAFGNPCSILIDEPDSMGKVVILRQDGWYSPVARGSLKPIKPTISQAQAKAVMEFATEHGLISEGQIWTSKERNIIEGPAND